jgi:copper chaperone CopZ
MTSPASQPRTYVVTGMTCEHCVRSVSEEIEAVAGVAHVSVALEPGLVTVTGDGFDDAAIAAAVAEAGYKVET